MLTNSNPGYIQDLAITLCRNTEMHKLINLKNVCEDSKARINEIIYPFRQRVLRGYYLSSKANSRINKKIDTLVYNNIEVVKLIKSANIMHDDLRVMLDKLKVKIDAKNNTDIVLPNGVKTEGAEGFKDKIMGVIKSEDLSKLLEYRDLICQI